jgi:photosystem II stability/assembly factor-like uncharacterized protein
LSFDLVSIGFYADSILKGWNMHTAARAALVALLLASAATGEDNMVKTQSYKWQSVRIVGGGFVTGIIMHPAEKGLMYARTDIGGAYRWEAREERWVPLMDWVKPSESNLMGIESIAVDPENPDNVYMAAGTYTKDWAPKGAILRSSDRGRTWQRTDMPIKMGGNEEGRQAGERLVARGKNLWFGSRNDGLWHSEDAGATWAKCESFPVKDQTNGVGIVFVIVAAEKMYAGVSTSSIASPNLYTSADGGKTWQALKDQPAGMLPIHGELDSAGMLYVTYGNAPGPNGMTDGAVWRLSPKKGTWKDITPLKPSETDRFGYAGLAVDRQVLGTLMVTTMDRWGRRDEIFRSMDGGVAWKRISPDGVWNTSLCPYLEGTNANKSIGHWIGDIEIDPHDSDKAYYVTGATVMGCADVTACDANKPTHWSVMADGIEETVAIDLVSPPAAAHLVSALGDICGFVHEDLNVSPQLPKGNQSYGTSTGLDFAEGDPLTIVRVGESRESYYCSITHDGGKTWRVTEGKPEGSGRSGSVAISADGKTIVWSPARVVPHYLNDDGKTWTTCGGLAAGQHVVADRAKASAFYAAAKDGLLYASEDGGRTFAARTNRLPANFKQFKAVPGKAGHLALATADGLFLSTDGGRTFEPLPGLTNVRRVGFGRAAQGSDYPAIFTAATAAGTEGFFRSDDRGKTWIRINDDQHQYGWTDSLTGDPRIYGRVYVGAGGRGIVYGDIDTK